MNLVPLLVLIFLAACDSPSVSVAGLRPMPVSVARFDFSVRVAGDRAEAIRTNRLWPPPRGDQVVLAAGAAFEAASGCALRGGTLRGDAAVQMAHLDCGKARAPPGPGIPMPEVSCSVDVDALNVGPTGEVYGVDCEVWLNESRGAVPRVLRKVTDVGRS